MARGEKRVTRYFYDCEFMENGPREPLHLISIGVAGEDGREYYAQWVDAPLWAANDFVKAEVIPHLDHQQDILYYRPSDERPPRAISAKHQCGDPNCPWKRRERIAAELLAFLDPARFGKPELWGHYVAYDHVALCQIFGTMATLPKGVPMFSNDLKQRTVDIARRHHPERGIALPKIDMAERGYGAAHNALADARRHREIGLWLDDYERTLRAEAEQTIREAEAALAERAARDAAMEGNW